MAGREFGSLQGCRRPLEIREGAPGGQGFLGGSIKWHQVEGRDEERDLFC